MDIIGLIVFIVGIAAFIAIVLVCVEAAKKKRSKCKKCKTQYDFDRDIEYSVENTYTEGNRQYATVAFCCHCPNCGAQNRFTRKYTVASIDNQGNIKENNLSVLIRRDFK